MIEEPFVHQIFTGKMKDIKHHDKKTNPLNKPWKTSIFKTPIEEMILLGKKGLQGDEESAVDKALFTYPIKHYKFWKDLLYPDVIDFGAMGENLAVLEMDEFTVCIGDTYQFGDAVVQVSQPHLPNWEVSRRFKREDLAVLMQKQGFTGWYCRVLKEGSVLSKIDLELIDRPFPEWSIAACNEVMHSSTDDFRLIDSLASCEALSVNWRKLLKARLRGQNPSHKKRLFGPH